MYIVDITRCENTISTDILVGQDSMDAKSKTINYLMDYALANYGVLLDKQLLDVSLNMEEFSFKQFINNNYSKVISDDLLIQFFPTDKEHCLFLKMFNKNIGSFPSIYIFNKNDIELLNKLKVFFINDFLINEYQNDIVNYEKNKLDYRSFDKQVYTFKNMKCESFSLYNQDGMFLEELLNEMISFSKLKEDHVNLNKKYI